ncbi:AraC family transcriptional regulator [Blautia sp. RD014234]|nr:AraC family transcriptional regulator [Blautia parvula]
MNQSDTLESGEHEADKLTALLLNVVDYISIHYPDNISVKDLADRCFITENHFRKVFTAYMKMSPARYINLVRIQMACDLLQMSNDPIADIAYKTGFETLTTFNRNFKKYLVFLPGNGETIPKIMNASFWNTISRQKKDGNAQKNE